MAEMTTEDRAWAALAEDNPSSSEVTLRLYFDALRAYVEADQNIRDNGTICAHPRTGAPITNPYLAVRNQQGKIISGARRVKGDAAMRILEGREIDR